MVMDSECRIKEALPVARPPSQDEGGAHAITAIAQTNPRAANEVA